MREDIEEVLKNWAESAKQTPIKMSTRRFITHWGSQRRGAQVTQRIGEDLKSYGLTTDPWFEYGWIDDEVSIVIDESDDGENDRVEGPHEFQETNRIASTVAGALRVGQVPSASADLVSITPSSSLAEAQSLMMRHDFSQLPVLSGDRDIRGMISWESLAQFRMHRGATMALSDCITPVSTVELTDDLLPLVPQIIRDGYVLVLARNRTLSGIVTTADLSEAFSSMAGPFLLVGECERYLRVVVDRYFETSALVAAARPGNADRTVKSSANLTFGELARLFEPVESWSRFNWEIDRSVFLAALEEARVLRNEVMHFSTDAIDQSSLYELANLVRWLKILSH
ncbi:CBS domain-containing protein [Saxibacter everestensis]|uniref:CBS domain-containing protein n=1 Tax=Saxibacter everestensis TaxID=2909229 RepID=A0ABY8QSY9_9MICO|nr:CBS domain-containing protein [Brevibacteriaceae bacterium ZFBP1038]